MIAPTMTDLLTALRTKLVGDRRALRTIHTYTKIASTFLATSPGSIPTTSQIDEFLGRPKRDGTRRAAAARNQELAALRSLAKVAVREKAWHTNPTEGVRFTRKVPRDPPFLGADELRQLFRAAAEHPPAGERPQILAILGLLSQTGLRVHELAALDVQQTDLLTATLLSVRGKGGTVHDLPLNTPAVALVTNWLPERATRVQPEEKALFVSSRGTRLAVRTIENWFVKLRTAMGTAKKVTPHTLRHSAATLALTTGTDLATVAELLRHSDLNTTRLYLHLVDTRRREAVHRLAVTVPHEVLDGVGGEPPSLMQAKEPVPATLESSTTARTEDLDDQYRLVA
jgi:integrase/recombinase XerC